MAALAEKVGAALCSPLAVDILCGMRIRLTAVRYDGLSFFSVPRPISAVPRAPLSVFFFGGLRAVLSFCPFSYLRVALPTLCSGHSISVSCALYYVLGGDLIDREAFPHFRSPPLALRLNSSFSCKNKSLAGIDPPDRQRDSIDSI